MLKLFEILFVSIVKPALVEGIVNVLVNDSSSCCSARIDDEYCNERVQRVTSE